MVKSFFDPEWMDLGVLGVYGRWLETNWVWAEWLTIYHAVFSIAIPIVLVELAYPEKRNDKWVGNKKFCGLIILLGSVTAFGNLFLTSYRPPLPQYLLSALTVVGLILFARKIPTKTGKNGHHQVWKPTRLNLVGFITATGFFLFFMAGPYLISQPLILMFLGGGLVFSVFLFLGRFHWDESTLYHKFALSAGALAFLILLTPLHELNTNRLDNTQGMAIIGLVALITLLFLRRKLKLASLGVKNVNLFRQKSNVNEVTYIPWFRCCLATIA
jgi:hypothetical protein